MRKIFLLVFVVTLFASALSAQEKEGKMKHAPAEDTTLPYLKYPTLPAFNMLLMDSATILNTYNIPEGKPIGLFFFDPDCSHCQKEVKTLLKSMDSIKDIQFYMITPVHSMTEIKKFYDDYHLSDYKNIIAVGRDYEFFFGTFFGVKYVPDLALYDGHKKLIKLLEGAMPVKELYKYTH